MKNYSYVNAADVVALEALYQQYRQNPENVDTSWGLFFQGFDFALQHMGSENTVSTSELQKELAVFAVIQAYRKNGSLFAQLDPLALETHQDLKLENFGLTPQDLDKNFAIGSELGLGTVSLKKILEHLKSRYANTYYVEYQHLQNEQELKWWQEKVEKNQFSVTSTQEKRALLKLSEAIELEKFLHKKFVGQKRFSVEGSESYLVLMDQILEQAASLEVQEMIMGMAHRGRINTLINIIKKPANLVFSEFEGKLYDDVSSFDGDVKYHLGYSSRHTTESGKTMQITLCPNPSHLETVDPVVLGLTRARIDESLKDVKKILPILVHGDAALAGQGVVYETGQMMLLPAYHVGGTIHIAINNQIGFTTFWKEARSTRHCTDIAKAFDCPVIHVNGDDIIAVISAAQWAVEYRQKFGKDIYIDLIAYRKYGHNEGDEPRFTQPLMYQKVDQRNYIKELYQAELQAKNPTLVAEVQGKINIYLQYLESEFNLAKQSEKIKIEHFLPQFWKDYISADLTKMLENFSQPLALAQLKVWGEKLTTLPTGKNYFRKSQKVIEDRAKMLQNNSLDWGMAELLAYASLVAESHPVRIVGQDVERGTFSHRHAVIKTEDQEEKITLLAQISKDQATFSAHNSLLSEYAAMGYEWGYALGLPKGLTIWEAQFGDFNNGAQIMIDQFLSASEDKWKVTNGLVLLLPHGFEGQGSEHSSARLERFLQLSADANWQIVNCTTPANFFQVLRRQVKRNFRKPLVVFTPKQLLRHPKAISTLEDLAQGTFYPILKDTQVSGEQAEKLIFCSGKIYYELLEKREKIGKNQVAIIRLEQLYPLPKTEILELIKTYTKVKQVFWVQEEPENMGAWTYLLGQLYRDLPQLEKITRPASASPAPGSHSLDMVLQKELIEKVFKD